jgi:hypothetical protein
MLQIEEALGEGIQYGGAKDKSTTDAIDQVYYKHVRGDTLIFLDCKKAYDSVERYIAA